jgi:hypothetical protein
MYEDLVELFEQSAANRTPIREIVGAPGRGRRVGSATPSG